MSQLKAILQYQEIDKKLYALERELAGCEERKEYVKAKKFIEAAAEKLDGYDAKAAGLKSRSAELTKKYLKTEEELKDYEHLDELVESGADIAFYKKKALALADTLKKLKNELAAIVDEINATDKEYQKLKKQVIAMQKQYKDALEKYNEVKASKEGEKKAIEGELAAVAKDISDDALARYKTKRKEKIFPVVLSLIEDRCPCGMTPPIAEMNKLAAGGTIECEYCHRIIYKA